MKTANYITFEPDLLMADIDTIACAGMDQVPSNLHNGIILKVFVDQGNVFLANRSADTADNLNAIAPGAKDIKAGRFKLFYDISVKEACKQHLIDEDDYNAGNELSFDLARLKEFQNEMQVNYTKIAKSSSLQY